MRSPDIKLSARSWSVCPPTSILLVSASVAPHAKSLQCHELTERALHEERGNAFYPRLAIAASPPADGKHPRTNWPRQTSFSRSIDHASLRFRHHKKSPGLLRIPPVATAPSLHLFEKHPQKGNSSRIKNPSGGAACGARGPPAALKHHDDRLGQAHCTATTTARPSDKLTARQRK